MMIYEFLRINACMCPLIKRQLLDVVDVSTNLNCTACLRLKKKNVYCMFVVKLWLMDY